MASVRKEKGGGRVIRRLGRKQTSSHAEWLDAFAKIGALISFDEVEAFAETAIERIRNTSGKKAFAWSGGKDSIVLADLCRRAGVTEGYFAYSDLDYPAFADWCLANKPDGVIPMHTGYDLNWLAEHQELIFAEGAVGQRWHLINQRGPFTKMYFDNGLDYLIVGHRVIDGNVCGENGVIRKKSGETRFAPMYDWPHEALLGYIRYHGLALPPIYGWKDGFVQGTHAWPEREFCKTLNQGYREVYEIDPSIVIEAAEKIPSAKHFLETEVLA